MGVNIGEAVTISGVFVGMIVVSVWVELTCKVFVATEPTGFLPVMGVGELDLPGRLQAERKATSAMDIERNLDVFNFAFIVARKILFGTIQFTRTGQITKKERLLL
jgi:hypothetical protein